MAPSASYEEDLQILRLEQPSQGWVQVAQLPSQIEIRAFFYRFSASPSPSTSEGEGTARIHDPNRIRPPEDNLTAAAIFVSQFLERYWPTGKFAIASGYAMLIRGSDRRTYDIDICMEPQGHGLPFRSMLQSERFILPSQKMFDQCLRFYVKTGPRFGDENCKTDRVVKVEYLLEGLRAPLFQYHIEVTSVLNQRVLTLDYFCLLKSKPAADCEREGGNDYTDIMTLTKTFSKDIRRQNHLLDQEYVQHYIADLENESPETFQAARSILMVGGDASPSGPSHH